MTKKRILPPIVLEENETEFFEDVIKLLKKNKAFDSIDLYQLTQLAQTWGMYVWVCDEIRMDKNKLIQEYENGSNISALYMIRRDALATFDKLAKLYGLNPKARQDLLAFRVDANKGKGLIAKMQDRLKAQRKAI